MKSLKLVAAVCFWMLACLTSEHVVAGPYADDMAKCLVKSAAPEDRTLLMKWIFSAMALHPDLSAMSSITTQQRDALSKGAGALFQRLLLESCRSETQVAVQNEGPQTVQYAFQILGQVAVRGLMTDPHVLEGMKSLAQGLDEEKLKALLAHNTPK
jgi:hypothetical protein